MPASRNAECGGTAGRRSHSPPTDAVLALPQKPPNNNAEYDITLACRNYGNNEMRASRWVGPQKYK